ncbi:MAG: DUF2490 domain-containing protein [Prolixibacteraceae bacterium]|nr:DUF2490 domain-containing protein [Prolixibacteraceae bacterium]MBN2774940.1 DUF2490 domain-containing protein [Prolixibacteraceae bacterium]
MAAEVQSARQAMNKKLIILFLIILVVNQVQAKTKNFGTWVEAEFSKKIFKKLEFSFKPEVRFQDDFSVDEYMFDGQLTLKAAKFLRLAGAYRYNIDVRNKGNETYHRFAFDVLAKKDWNRLEGSFRTRFTDYTEFGEENSKSNFLRYQLKFEYDLKNCKLRPYTSYELFHDLTEKEINKGRFTLGGSYKLTNNSRIELCYHLQSYFLENSVNIIGVSYKIEL